MTSLNAGGDFAKQIRERTGQVPISEFVPQDIFVVAYPKSGNTWFQNLAAGVVFGVNPEYAPDSLIQELVPDVDYKQFYKRFLTPMIFKSHHRPRSDYRRVVNLLRDGRDVVVSHLHYRAALFGECTAPDQISFVQEDAGNWQRHVNAWRENPFGAETLTIRYEDLLVDAPRELRRFCEFAGFERDDQFLEGVAVRASFQKMRQKEKAFGWDNPIWPKDKAFVRRGIAGSYRNEMRPELLQAFLERAAETLRRCDYPI